MLPVFCHVDEIKCTTEREEGIENEARVMW